MSISIFLGLLVGFALFWRIPDCTGAKPAQTGEKVTIIIPARNEAENLRKLLPSLHGESAEVIVADDQSEDETAAVAAAYGAKVIQLPPLPQEWLGKSWGCWNGAKAASGDLLLFLDADTVMEKGGVQRLLHRFREERATLLSVHPFHVMKHPYEYTSAFFHLIVFASMGAFHLLRDMTRPNGAFGQCLLCRRKDYFQYGGHAAHPPALLETYMFARHVMKQGGSVAHVSGRGAVSMRMYPDGFSSLAAGWSKSFAKGAGSVPLPLLVCILLWLNALFSWLPYAAGFTSAAGILYALFSLQLYLTLRKIGSFGLCSALLFPVNLLAFLCIFSLSAGKTLLLRRVGWKGRMVAIKRKE
ncbi:glycosyltransferase [Ectobacillus ponti]|uniref:4,4'-diaponeurosporenoate glycosyltransferase n=1 Tax=Ectobacillus ponti TaxID=2961894 RepID=A0AA41X9H9_9BACI|nr:glycosyltransferase [Ectobacillus ponti]